MRDDPKLLVLGADGPQKDRRLGLRIERRKALTALAAVGAKVRHDSGGRLLVIDASAKAIKELASLLPDARVMAVSAGARQRIASLDSTEVLFLSALKIRSSKAYRAAKKKRKIGESPEERLLFSAPDTREE